MRNLADIRYTTVSRLRTVVLAAIIPTILATGGVTIAQQVGSTDTVRPANIHTGTCASPGEIVFELRDLVVGPDDRGTLEFIGAQEASVIEGSDSTVQSATLTDLTAAPHIIAVFESEGSDVIIACGEIGGFVVSNDDDLAIGLREQNDSGVAGIDGDDDDAEVEVDVYVARDVVDSAATPGI